MYITSLYLFDGVQGLTRTENELIGTNVSLRNEVVILFTTLETCFSVQFPYPRRAQGRPAHAHGQGTSRLFTRLMTNKGLFQSEMMSLCYLTLSLEDEVDILYLAKEIPACKSIGIFVDALGD